MLSSFILGAVIGGIGVKYGSKLVKRLGNEENPSVVRQIVDVVKTVAEDTVEGTKEILSENLDILNYSINEIVNEHNNKKYDDLDDELFDREGYGSFEDEDEECNPFDEDDECDLF